MWRCLLFLALAAGQKVTLCTGDCPNGATSFPTLDSAIEASQGIEAATVILNEESGLDVARNQSLRNKLRIEGNGQLVLLKANFIVETQAEVRIRGVQFGLESTSLRAAWTIYGEMVLEECGIVGFNTVFAEVAGALNVSTSAYTSNIDSVISIVHPGAAVSLIETKVTNHTGIFLAAGYPPVWLLIQNCQFVGNFGGKSKILIKLSYTQVASYGSAYLADSVFEGNSLPILGLSVSQFNITLSNCTFRRNTQGAISGSVLKSFLTIASSSWYLNGGIAISLSALNGVLSLSNSVLTNQTELGFIRIVGTSPPQSISGLPPALCLVSISRCVIANTTLAVPGSLGLIDLHVCAGQFAETTISRVNMTAADGVSIPGLVNSYGSLLQLGNCYIEHSGTTNPLLYSTLGQVVLRNTVILEPYAVQDEYLSMVMGVLQISNLTMIGGTWVTRSSYYMVLFNTQAVVSDLRILGNSRITYSVMGIIMCKITFTGLRLDGIREYSFITILSSSAVFVNTDIRNCQLESVVSQFSQSNITLQNTTLTAVGRFISPLEKRNFVLNSFIRIFALGGATNFTVNGLHVWDMQFESLVNSKHCFVQLREVSVSNCSFQELIKGANLETLITGAKLYNISSHGLIFGRNGTTTIHNSTLEAISTDGVLFRTTGQKIHMEASVMKNCHSRLSFGLLSGESSMSISNSVWEGVSSGQSQGVLMTTGTLNVRNMTVVDFGMTLFQVTKGLVTIQQSQFRNGINTDKLLTSHYSFGGVLGCLDCSIAIDDMAVVNLTALYGGAMSIRYSPVTIRGSTFRDCLATRGGAIYIQNAPFRIENCAFVNNIAYESGGGLEVSIRENTPNIVISSLFELNKATEGGAVKWRSAQVYLSNVTFRDNSAGYGANVASYGVSLSARSTNLTGAEVSGVALPLVFELLDHYGALVTAERDTDIQLLNTSTVDFLGSKIRFINKGVFNFTPLTVYAEPGTSQDVTVSLNTIEGDYHLTILSTLQIAFRNCTVGEVYHSDRCEYCPPGYFSFAPSDPECRNCPPTATCGGGNQFSLNPGYWRNASDSALVLVCPLGDKCLGGPNSTCTEGFTGTLCNECAPGYYWFRATECQQCSDTALTWLLILIVIPLYILFVVGILRFSVYHPNDFKLFLIKTLISHAQYLSFLAFLRVSLPSATTYALHAISYLSSLLITDLPLACFGARSPEYMRAIIGSLLLPTAGLTSVVVVWMRRETLKGVGTVLCAQLMFTPMIAILSAAPLLACYEVFPRQLLFADMKEQCWSPTHTTFVYALTLPSLLINILVPILAAVVLLKGFKLQLANYLLLWKSGYRVPLWDLYLMTSLVAYGLVLVGTQVSTKLTQLVYGLIVLITFGTINAGFQHLVYSRPYFFWLSEASFLIISVCHGLEVYYIYNVPGQTAWDYFNTVLFFLLNGGYFTVLSYFLIAQLRSRLYTAGGQSNKQSRVPPVPHNSYDSHIVSE